ncbi:MAG: fused MFS/spermidine synthase [Candidatus Latescibacteria bacterium]|nr:fused MFS/spermidine synthase [Candidatus Latescibacterota bacterium]
MGIIFLVFFLSGACALAYQIIWIRLLGLVFGGTVISMSVVIAAFMGGLAIGSRIIGRYASKIGNLVRFYGILELILGVIGLLVFFGISHLSGLIYSIPIDIHADTLTGVLIRLVISFIILIIPTFIMGGTLPVLIRGITGEKKKIIVNTGLLYACNTLGAMTGALLVGFFLIRYMGMTRTNFIAVTINLLMGCIALILSRRFVSKPDVEPVPKPSTQSSESDKGLRFIIALAITGFTGLTLEMVWMRMLLLVANNTIYLYTIVITIVLFGLGLGGLTLSVLIPPKKRTERTFGLILTGIALTTAAGFILFPLTTYIGFASNPSYYSTFLRLSFLTAITTGFLGFLPVFLMGLSLPIGVGLYAREISELSNRVGVIYAVNTVGSLLGSLATVFVLIPMVGITGTVVICVTLTMIPALYFISTTYRGNNIITVFAGIVVIWFISVIFMWNLNIPSSILGRKINDGEYIEYIDEGKSSTIWITNKERGFRKIWMDNLWVSSTSREGTHALLAHYPVLFHPNPKKVAGIAFGTGQTFGTCLLYPIEKIDCVEIDPEIITACQGRFTEENYGVLEDPRTEIIIDDGRFFLAGTKEKFDIVTAEPLQPYTRGTVNLYSYEFYEACKRTLLHGGIVAQWIPLYNSGVFDSWSLIRTFAVSFDHVLFFLNGSDGILLGSDTEMRIDPSAPIPPRALDDMTRIENENIYNLAGNFICSKKNLLKASEGYPIITDDRPTLEFTAPISHWTEEQTGPVEMRRHFLQIMEPIDQLFTGEVDWDTARKFSTSRQLINRGYIADKTGNIREAHEIYQQAYKSNPRDVRAIKSLFMFLRKYNRLQDLPPELHALIRPPQQTR